MSLSESMFTQIAKKDGASSLTLENLEAGKENGERQAYIKKS